MSGAEMSRRRDKCTGAEMSRRRDRCTGAEMSRRRDKCTGADRVAKHRELADAGLVKLEIRVDEVGLQELLIAARILPQALLRNPTRGELAAGLEELAARFIAMHEAAIESAGGALQHEPLRFAFMVGETDSHEGNELP